MTTLHDPVLVARWLRERVTGDLRTDSRQIRPGDAFIAWPGAATDGRQYLQAALAQGASACLLEAEGADAWAALLAASLPLIHGCAATQTAWPACLRSRR